MQCFLHGLMSISLAGQTLTRRVWPARLHEYRAFSSGSMQRGFHGFHGLGPSFEGLPSKITMRKLSAYTALTLELRTSASTVAITHVCQLLHQEFDARMACVHVYYQKHVATMGTMSEASERNKLIHALLRLQLGMAICYQYEGAYFPAPYVDNQQLCSL